MGRKHHLSLTHDGVPVPRYPVTWRQAQSVESRVSSGGLEDDVDHAPGVGFAEWLRWEAKIRLVEDAESASEGSGGGGW